MRLFVALAFLLFVIVLPILMAASLLAIFAGEAMAIVVSICMTVFSLAALLFCIRMASTRIRARSYLKKFPDLLGAMEGTFNANGLVLEDTEKTHWFPWVQLSSMAVSNAGVRIPLDNDPRRFLALAEELFDGFRPCDMEQLHARNRVAQSSYDELAKASASVFQKEIGAPSYYCGWFNQSTSWSTWLTLLFSPVFICLFIAYRTFQGDWNWIWIALVITSLIGTLSGLLPLLRLIRNRGRTTVMCWGWLNENELIYGSGTHVMKIPMASMKYIGRDAEILEFVLASGQSLHVFRSVFQDVSHFDTVCTSLDRLNTTEEDSSR